MRFELDDDQRDFAGALDALLASADTVAVARSWADGDTAPGLKLWARLAELGVTSLATDATPVEVCVAFEALGRHAVPGPWVESAAYLPVALGHEVDGVATVALPPHVPYALDADVADQVYVGSTAAASVGAQVGSVDRTRRLFEVTGDGDTHAEAFDLAVLATSAQLLGAGERILADSVTYVKQRKQFGARDRFVPGDQAPPRRRRASRSTSPARWCSARLSARSRPRPRRSPALTRHTAPRAPASRCTARSATRRSST